LAYKDGRDGREGQVARAGQASATRFALAALLLLAGASLVAQQPGTVDPTAIPVEQEPHHRLVFTNDFVRVIDAVLPPLYVSEKHTHSLDNVAVTIQMGSPKGQSRVGFAGFARGGYSHVITNPNTGPMRFIDVELRAADRVESEGELEQQSHEVVLSNARVRVSRVTLEPGATIDEHSHASGYVTVTIRGGEGAGVWRWHPSAEPASAVKSGRTTLEMVEIEPR
jgi:hypothetical protein